MAREQNSGNQERGFAGMSEEEQREIARKGGEAVSEDREHMSVIGRKGAEKRNEERGSGGGGRGNSGGGGGGGGGNRGGGNR